MHQSHKEMPKELIFGHEKPLTGLHAEQISPFSRILHPRLGLEEIITELIHFVQLENFQCFHGH